MKSIWQKILIILITIFFGSGCVYFNTFYNAEQAYKNANTIIDETLLTEDGEIPTQANKLLEEAIIKSSMVIEKFPDSKYIDDAYYIIGKSSFLLGEIGKAERNFNKLIFEFPNSPYFSECKIWIPYCYLKIGKLDSAYIEIENIIQSGLKKKQNKYLAHILLAEIALERDSLNKAYIEYEIAAKFADNDGRKSTVFSKLVEIAEENNDMERAVKFLENVVIFSNSSLIKQNAKMKWIEYNRKLGNYEDVLDEIESLLALSEYFSLKLTLELEKSKLSIAINDVDQAKNSLIYLVENNSKKKETAEAYFYLGEIALFEDMDIVSARDYFESVSEEFGRSEFRSGATTYLTKISRYEDLLESYEISDKTTVQSIDSTSIVFISSTIDSTAQIIVDTMMDSIDTSEVNPEENIIIADSLLYFIAEALHFDFQQTDLAIERYKTIYSEYPFSKYASQSVYFISQMDSDSIRWRSILFNEYPNSNYSLQNIDEKTDKLDLINMRDVAWELLETNMIESVNEFQRLCDEFNDTLSCYNTAIIYDYYLDDYYQSIEMYLNFIENFPDNSNVINAKQRIDEIKGDIENIRDNYQSKMSWQIGREFLVNQFAIDSAVVYFNKSKNFSSSSAYGIASSRRLRLISELKDYIQPQMKILNDSVLVDSLSKFNEIDYDQRYSMACLFHQLNLLDSAMVNYQLLSTKDDVEIWNNALFSMYKITNNISWLDSLNIIENDSIFTIMDEQFIKEFENAPNDKNLEVIEETKCNEKILMYDEYLSVFPKSEIEAELLDSTLILILTDSLDTIMDEDTKRRIIKE